MQLDEAGGNGGWRGIIRTERRRVGLTQAGLGALVGVGAETIRKYEQGTRLPPRDALERILEVLQVPVATVHQALTDRGFHHPEFRFPLEKAPGYYFAAGELQAFVDKAPWPAFSTNELGEVAAANRAAQALWGIDLAAWTERRGRARANLFVAMAEPRFASRLVNWDEIVRHFIALYKAVPATQALLEEDPGALFGEVIGAVAAANPQALGRIYALWESTPRITDKVRWMYPIVWREPGFAEIRFQGIVSPASELDGTGFNDWIPVDAASHATLEALLASRGAGRPEG